MTDDDEDEDFFDEVQARAEDDAINTWGFEFKQNPYKDHPGKAEAWDHAYRHFMFKHHH